MQSSSTAETTPRPAKLPLLKRSLAVMKPITWFAPMWAFTCGAIASGGTSWALPDISRIVLGVVMAGPVLCGLSQVINDYFDREVDAVNEPQRLIPSGQISLTQVFVTIGVLVMVGLAMAFLLGKAVLMLVGLGLIAALLYSAPPFRAKQNGWFGNALVGLSYEGLAWVAGHMVFAPITGPSLLIAALYSFGTHGIMSINDYKSIEGDRQMGIKTIPVQLGPIRAAWLIVITMNLAQLAVFGTLLYLGLGWAALGVVGIILVQLPIQRSFLKAPQETYLKFSAIGVSFFVWGMMVAAVGLHYLGR